jgi:hypothetical protein
MFLTEKLAYGKENSCSSMTMNLHTQQTPLSLYFRNTLNAYKQKITAVP